MHVSIASQTALLTFTGLASTNRAKTIRDAADTILELGGSYTPTGTWTSLTMVTPVLGTPTSGNLANCTFPTLNQNTSGSAATLTTARNINGVSFNGSANITVTAAGSTLSDPVTFANGANTGSAATSATTGTITVNMTTSVITCTPTGAMQYNGSGGVTGQISTFVITTSGTSSFVLTFGTNFKSQGTLATGTTTAKVFTVTFRCYATNSWAETGRTTAM